MAVTVDEVIVSLEAKLDRYTANLAKAQRDFQNATDRMERNSKHAGGAISRHFDDMGRSVKRALLAFAGIEGIRRLGSAINSAIQNADDLKDLATLLGITTDALQALQQQAEEFGSSADELNNGLKFFGRQLGLAAAGSGDLLKILQANNVALKDSRGNMRPFMDLLRDYANLIRNAADEQGRLVLTAVGFGRGSSELASTLAIGSKGIDDWATRAKSTGRIIDTEVIDRLAAMKPLMDEIKDKWTAAWYASIIASDGFFDKVFRKSAELQNWLEHLPGSSTQMVQPVDRVLTPDQRLNQAFRSDFSGNAALEAELRKRGSIAAGGTVGIGSDRNFPITGDGSTIIPDLSPPPDTAKRWAEATAAIEADTEVLRRQAETVGATRFEQEKAIATQQLMNEALRDGIAVTPELTTQIDKLATAHANAVVSLEKLEEAEGRATERIDAFKDGSKEVLSGFIQDIRAGTDAMTALANATQRLLDKLLDASLNGIFDVLLGTSGQSAANRGGMLTGIIASLFGGGRQHGGDVEPGRWYNVGEMGPERFFPRQRGRIERSDPRGGPQKVQVEFSGNFDMSPLLVGHIEHRAKQAEERAIARAPVVMRDANRRTGRP